MNKQLLPRNFVHASSRHRWKAVIFVDKYEKGVQAVYQLSVIKLERDKLEKVECDIHNKKC